MEFWSYILFYFCHSLLPWQGLKIFSKKEKYNTIMDLKKSTTLKVFDRGLLKESTVYISPVHALT